jgi:hypothetical protein
MTAAETACSWACSTASATSHTHALLRDELSLDDASIAALHEEGAIS